MAAPQIAPTYPTLPAYQAPQAAATQSGGAFAPYKASMPTTPTDIGAMIANHITSSLAAQGSSLGGGWNSGVANMAAATPQIEAADRAYAENQDDATRIAGINASQQSNAQRTAEMSAANQNQFNQGVYRGQADLAGRVYGAQIQNALGRERLSQGLKLGLGEQKNQYNIANLNDQTRQQEGIYNATGSALRQTILEDSLNKGPNAWANLGPATSNVANALRSAAGMPGYKTPVKTPAKASSTM